MVDNLKCPVCHRMVLKVVALNDNGSGVKMCRDCKRKSKKAREERIANLF